MKRTPPLQPARQINVDVKGMTEAFTFDQGGYARMHACMHVCMCNERRRENELRDERAVVVRAQLLNFWSNSGQVMFIAIRPRTFAARIGHVGRHSWVPTDPATINTFENGRRI